MHMSNQEEELENKREKQKKVIIIIETKLLPTLNQRINNPNQD